MIWRSIKKSFRLSRNSPPVHFISPLKSWIYNNRIDLKYKLTDIKQNNNFVVRTVDNDEDDIAEVVFVYEYKDCIVEKVYEETGVITLKNGFTLNGSRNITLDEEKITFEIYDAKGAKKAISDIAEDEEFLKFSVLFFLFQ